MNLKLTSQLLTGAAALAISLSANAIITVDNWTFNATGLDGSAGAGTEVKAANGVINNISFLGFQATYNTITTQQGAAHAGVALNDTFNVQANGTITSFQDISSTVINPIGFNNLGSFGLFNGYELSFTFDVNGKFSTNPTGANLNTNFDHTSGTLNFYVDSLPLGATSKATPFTSVTNSTTNGGAVLVASFAVVNDLLDPTYGGVFSAALGNGGDRTLFELTYNGLNVFRDSLNNPLALGSTLAVTNSDFQSSVTVGGAPFQYNPSAYACGKNLLNFCGTESGQFRLAASPVPEPGTIALLSLGLLGIGGFARRSNSKRA